MVKFKSNSYGLFKNFQYTDSDEMGEKLSDFDNHELMDDHGRYYHIIIL